MKQSKIIQFLLIIAIFSLTSISCKKESKSEEKKVATPSGQKAKSVTPPKKIEKALAHVPCGNHKKAVDHVPCGNHKTANKADLFKHPSVFKTEPAVGTKVSCPIKGETFAVTKQTPRTTYEGKVYMFGCNGCKSIFLKDPKAALKKYKFIEAK
jgi:YHS domain-containing protein